MIRALLSLTVCAALAGCGNDPNRTDPLRILGLSGPSDEAASITPEQMARAALAQLAEPVMLVRLESDGRVALMVPLGANGPVTTWTTVDRQTIALRYGRVIATRGLGTDLMSSTAGSPSGSSRHSMITLDAAHQPVRTEIVCSNPPRAGDTVRLASGVALRATRTSESCHANGTAFRNDFWVVEGKMRRSRQWLGDDSGYLTIEVLRP